MPTHPAPGDEVNATHADNNRRRVRAMQRATSSVSEERTREIQRYAYIEQKKRHGDEPSVRRAVISISTFKSTEKKKKKLFAWLVL
jgi:hypothetical protein